MKSEHENIQATKFRISDLDRADIFISASPLYSDLDEEFTAVNHILDVLWKRMSWTEPIFLVMREAANLIYSRIKVRKNQIMAKSEALYMLRESRHCGLALGLDSIKHTSIDIDVRTLTDYLLIKNTGMHGLPQDLWWVYKVFDPHALRKLHPKEFIIVDRQGRLGLGTFALPTWHKREKENILVETGLELQYYQPAAKENNLRALISEALSSLSPEPEPSEVAAWIRENKGVDASPVAIGQQLRSIGYRTDFVFMGGKGRRVIRKNQ